MKCILLADNRSDLLATLNPILKHWGYRVISTRRADHVMAFLQESAPCLLIVGEGLLIDPDLALTNEVKQRIASGELPCIILKQDPAVAAEVLPGEALDVPVELFELFSFIQRRVEKHPRQNLRLRLKLPGMYCLETDDFILAEVLSLSMSGLFFKSSARIKRGDNVTVVFPLLGKGREVEFKSTVLYTILPEADNNFFQGFGVGFDDVTDEHREHLHLFIKDLFLKEVSANRDGVGNFTKDQLRD